VLPEQVIRAWKDTDGTACRAPDASLPANPVGPIDIDDSALDVTGGYVARTEYVETLGCCQGFTQAGKCDFTAGVIYCTMGCLTIVWTTESICGKT